jgi:hypothetical protein
VGGGGGDKETAPALSHQGLVRPPLFCMSFWTLVHRHPTHTAPHAHSQVSLQRSDFDTLLAVYTGSAVTALTRVAFNDDCSGASFSCVNLPVTPGVPYSIQVDGWSGRRGTVRIAATFSQSPGAVPGDAVASPLPVPLTGVGSRTLTTSTAAATREPGEPQMLSGSGESASIWFSWVVPRRGTLRVNTLGSAFNTLAAVYLVPQPATAAGPFSFPSLVQVAVNNDCSPAVTTSCVQLVVAPGAVYLVQVDGVGGAKGAASVTFSLF